MWTIQAIVTKSKLHSFGLFCSKLIYLFLNVTKIHPLQLHIKDGYTGQSFVAHSRTQVLFNELELGQGALNAGQADR